MKKDSKRFVIKLDFAKVNAKAANEFINLYSRKRFQKHVIRVTPTIMFVTIPLFNSMEYDLGVNRKIFSSVRISLLLQTITYDKNGKRHNKIREIVKPSKMNKEEYDELLRLIRF